tara:strand:- start:195 stop:404 length:210 start_codon:yes stop_codon:yes gene_type:complete
LILNIHKLIIFYHPKFIKLKPAIKKITSQTKPLIKKKVKLPKRKYLPNLFFVKNFLNQASKGINSINQI